MRQMRFPVLMMTVACSNGDAREQEAPACDTEPADSAPDTGEDGPPCVEGWEMGLCPPDFTLVDARDELRSLSEFRGQPVLVLGTAEW